MSQRSVLAEVEIWFLKVIFERVLGRRVGLMVQFKIMMRTQAAQMETAGRCKSVKPVTGGLARKARTKTSWSKRGFTKPGAPQSSTSVKE